MKCFGISRIWIISFLAIGTLGCGSSSKEVMGKLDGSWTLVEATEKGKPSGGIYKGSAKFDKDFFEIVISLEGAKIPRAFPVLKGRYSLNTSETPWQIDLIPEQDQSGVLTNYGILEFDGSKLKLCFANAGQGRPGSLLGLSDGETLLVLEKK